MKECLGHDTKSGDFVHVPEILAAFYRQIQVGGVRVYNSGRKEARMPLIEIHLIEGRTDEQKKALCAAVTEAVRASIGAPVEAIRVWLHEFSPKDYMAAGIWFGDRNK